MNKIEFWITLIIGVMLGVIGTRFFYSAAINITTFLMLAAIVLLIVILIKIRSHKKK